MKILYFSTVNWRWIKQRPHFICEYISNKKIEVVYFSITPFLKQKIFHKELNRYLHIRDKFVIPYASKFKIIKKINSTYIKLLLNEKYDIVILTHPEQYDYLPKKVKNDARIIYDCMDNNSHFYKGSRREYIENIEKEMCKKVHHIITSSNYLKNKIIRDYGMQDSEIDVIKNALDISLEKEFQSSIKLKSPNLIYVGTISEWVDINILNKFALNNPQYTIYLIGPVDTSISKKIKVEIKNIIFLGAIEHEEVKKYIKAGEIMLIPFKINELVKGVDPVKLYEYLAFNKPVISSYWEELEEYVNNNLVHFYENYNQFLLAIEKIKNEYNEFPGNNTEFIKVNTWEKRVEAYLKVMEKLCDVQLIIGKRLYTDE